MKRERTLTLEALRVLDEIDRRGSFAAAAEALGRVPSALSYTIQKLEDELDIVIYDRSGHRTKLTHAGQVLLEQGRILLRAADKITNDVITLSKGWERELTIVCEALFPTEYLFPLIKTLNGRSDTEISLMTEVLSGTWETLERGEADIVIAPSLHFNHTPEINSQFLYHQISYFVAAKDHPIHQEDEPFSDESRQKYRGVAMAGTAKERAQVTVQLLERQQRLRVSTLRDKKQAILYGLGIGSLPLYAIEKELDSGDLVVVANSVPQQVDMIMAWRRDAMGEAKSFLLREIPKLFKPH